MSSKTNKKITERNDNISSNAAFIDGLGGNDQITGGSNDQVIYGGSGNDVIRGKGGDDELWGGSGNDTFVFEEKLSKNGVDTIKDFEVASYSGDRVQGDILDLSEALEDVKHINLNNINQYAWVLDGQLYIDRRGGGSEGGNGQVWANIEGINAGDQLRIKINKWTNFIEATQSGSAPDTTAPLITASQSFDFNENQTANAVVATVLASDNLAVTAFRFENAGGTASDTSTDGYFTIANDGKISITAAGVAAGVNDYETAENSHTYSIQAGDAAGNWSSAVDVALNELDVTEGVVLAARDFTNTLTTIGATSNKDCTLGIYNDVGGLLIGSVVNITQDTPATITFAPELTVTYATLKVQDNSSNFAPETLAIVLGTNNVDTIDVTTGSPVVYGFDGDDVFSGANGSAKFYGGAGNDSFTVNQGLIQIGDLADNDALIANVGETVILATVLSSWVATASTLTSVTSGWAAPEWGTTGDAAVYIRSTAGVDTTIDASSATATNYGYRMFGNTGNDTITGTVQADIIDGGDGADNITLGSGADTLIFNNLTAVDVITDFLSADDSIQLSKAIFSGLGALGALSASEFLSGANVTAATDTSQRMIYDTTAGNLYYNADGRDNISSAILVASFTGAPSLLLNDFSIIA